MAWLAVDKDGQEFIFPNRPEWNRVENCWESEDGEELVYEDYADFSLGTKWATRYFYGVELPKGTIKKLIGRELIIKDNPVELL